MPNHTRTDMWISIGFATSFFVAFLVTVLAQDGMSGDQVEAIWTVAISIGFINHGIWNRESGLVLGGSLSIAATLISLAFAPASFPVGWIVLGCAVAVSGFYRAPRTENLLIGVYIALGGFLRLLSIYLSTSFLSAWMVWMVLVGLMITTVAMEGKNLVMRFMGVSCILVSVVSYTFFPEFMFLSVALVFAVGMPVNLVYLYRLLGRTPKIGEIFSFATRALFLHGLKKPIDQYSVIAILIKGNIGAEKTIHDLISHLDNRCAPILLLGPTAPTQLSLPKNTKIGWVTTISGVSELEYPILSPEDPSMVSVFLNKTLRILPTDSRPVIIGDFLDNMIPHMDESLFYKYYSDLASAARILNHTAVFIVKADIHSEVDVNIVKRFADVIIENREREEKGRLIREVRVSNRMDNVYKDWKKYSMCMHASTRVRQTFTATIISDLNDLKNEALLRF
jgi:hypothetical protein